MMSSSNSNIKKKKTYPTATQKRHLLKLINNDAELRSGKFSSTFTKQIAFARWEAIADQVNAIPGAKKSGKEWRKTYQDKKSKAKTKAATLRRSARQITGGGSPSPTLDEDEELLLGSIAKEVTEGLPTQESEVVFVGPQRKRMQPQKRLQRSLDAATTLQKTLEDKNSLKKEFYHGFLKCMAEHTAAMQSIAKSLKQIAESYR